MSIPRYSPNPLWFGMPIVDNKEGKLCEYRHYVKLEAENARLKAEVTDLKSVADQFKAEVERLDTLSKQLMAQHSDISCENIMLRKAGDAMADRLMYQGYPKTVPAWNAAKEGKGQP